MGEEEYINSYLTRAEFFPATSRTLEGLHGMIFRKDINIEVPETLKTYLDNVDGEGSSLNQFINDVTWDCMQTGFGGVLIDAPESVNNSVLDAEQNGNYPYLEYYDCFKIINWHFERVGRQKILQYVILEEHNEVQTSVNQYTKEIKKQYRVLELDEEGYYKQTLYNDNQAILNEVYPTKFGQRMRYIPFYFVPNKKPYTPMMLNLAHVNIAWYRKSADLENGAHWTGIPTPYSIGYTPETMTITDKDGNSIEVPRYKMELGGTKFLYFPLGTTAVGFLEFNGAGLSQLQNMMTQDEDRMAILGARIISQERKGVESAETAKIHRAGENSVLATFANELSNVFTAIIKDYLEWISASVINEDISLQINTDYDVASMSTQELVALVSLWQSGGISHKILFENLKEGEIVKGDMTFEEMADEIKAEQETAGIERFNATDDFEQENENDKI